MNQPLLNLKDYTLLELIFFGSGCVLWIVAYAFTIKNIVREKFIEIPLIAVCGNIAWEFLWSWVFVNNMGSLFVWGYRTWFFLDCFITYSLFRYGYKQITNPSLRSWAKPIIVFTSICWLFIFYFYIKNYDAPLSGMGIYSGIMLNVVMSALYISLYFNLNNRSLFSAPIAWSKGVGTLLISVFSFLHFTDGFLLSLCVINAVLDGVYIYIVLAKKHEKQLQPTVATEIMATV
jgi:hypothetical protein